MLQKVRRQKYGRTQLTTGKKKKKKKTAKTKQHKLAHTLKKHFLRTFPKEDLSLKNTSLAVQHVALPLFKPVLSHLFSQRKFHPLLLSPEVSLNVKIIWERKEQFLQNVEKLMLEGTSGDQLFQPLLLRTESTKAACSEPHVQSAFECLQTAGVWPSSPEVLLRCV